jgi:UDPglucose--hexose-1-phosphate uridylyltransferase
MSQFRKNPVSGEWVLIAPERAKRPHKEKAAKRAVPSKAECLFEDLQKSGNWPPIKAYEEKGKWRIVLLPNKFPAFRHALCPVPHDAGLEMSVDGIGYHELLVTRDHAADFAALPPEDALQVFQFFKERYATIDADECMEYLSIFANWGPASGASIAHPHYQLMAMPVLPPFVARSLAGSAVYYKRTRHCIHCDMIRSEERHKKRVIGENKDAIAFAPFAPSKPYEMKIFPKKHFASFGKTPDTVLRSAVELLQGVLHSVKKKLGDPDYNFFIHTAPLGERKEHAHYHWHIEVTPHTSLEGGFELATGIQVNVVDPDAAAKLLRI